MTTATQERPRTTTSSTTVEPAETAPPGHRVLFRVAFRSSMSDADLERLNRLLDLATHTHPKTPAVADTPGVARLDFDSGLFLLRGEADEEWVLEARTWGAPPTRAVRDWFLRAADAARMLDSRVPQPGPGPGCAWTQRPGT